MKPHITLVTLGVADLTRATEFYEKGLGLPVRERNDSVVFFEMQGTLLGLFPREELARDIGIEDDGSGFGGITLAHNLDSPEAVDRLLDEAVAAGATLVKPGQKVFWGGYSGYFRDPDGHYWEVAWNPFW